MLRSSVLLFVLFASVAAAQETSSSLASAASSTQTASARIVADPSLVGSQGTSRRKHLEPFVVQSVVFNRAAEMTEEMRAKWTAFDVETLEVGETLFGIDDYYCTTRAVCVGDTNADSRFDTTYTQVGGDFWPFNFRTAARPWAPAPAGYRLVEPPDAFRHEIGIAFFSLRSTGSGEKRARFWVLLRRANGEQPWQPFRGTEVDVSIPESGEGVLQIMGARIAIRLIDDKQFSWKVEESMPEQPLLGRVSSGMGS